MVARLTYSFQPVATLEGDPTRDSDFEFVVYGGDRPENRISSELPCVARRQCPYRIPRIKLGQRVDYAVQPVKIVGQTDSPQR